MQETGEPPSGRPLRVLLVEDTEERQACLRDLFRDHAWILAANATRALRLIRAYPFDLICLDFDLEGEEKGDDVARGIADSANSGTAVLIHSMNPTGAERIRAVLPHAVWVPIASLVRTNAVAKRVRGALHRGVPTDWHELLREPPAARSK